MSLTYGFYNSVNGDRKYDAVQLSSIFDGIIQDGVFQHVGGRFMVIPDSGMNVKVSTGRAWFNHTWTLNDAPLPITLDPADVVNPRIDAVILQINATDNARQNVIEVIKGIPSPSPLAPPLTTTSRIHQYPLAYIRVNPGATSITASDITNKVGTDVCPYVTAPLEKMSIDELIAKWESQWNARLRDWDEKATTQRQGFENIFQSNLRSWETQASLQRGDLNRTWNIWYTGFTENAKKELEEFLESFGDSVVTGPRVLYYIPGGADAELPNNREIARLTSRAISGVNPSTNLVEGDILIDWQGNVAKVLENPNVWSDRDQDYITSVIGLERLDPSKTSNSMAYTTLELANSSNLIVKIHNVGNMNGLRIKVQKLTGNSKKRHRWTDDPIGFAGAKAIENSAYADIPIPDWMPNNGVFKTRFDVTQDVFENGLVINLREWLLDAIKPILRSNGGDENELDLSDNLSGFADGSYIALLGEYLCGVEPDGSASRKKYSLDVRYRFVLCDSDGATVGTTRDALAIPYKTFWKDGKRRPRYVVTTTEDGVSIAPYLNGSFRVVAT